MFGLWSFVKYLFALFPFACRVRIYLKLDWQCMLREGHLQNCHQTPVKPNQIGWFSSACCWRSCNLYICTFAFCADFYCFGRSINQSMFICRQQPNGFSKRRRLLTEPPCWYMQSNTNYRWSSPCTHCNLCKDWQRPTQCQRHTYRSAGPG